MADGRPVRQVMAGPFLVLLPTETPHPGHEHQAVIIGIPGPHGGETSMIQVNTDHGWIRGLACSVQDWAALTGAIKAGELDQPGDGHA
jgi:hypothetical protein